MSSTICEQGSAGSRIQRWAPSASLRADGSARNGGSEEDNISMRSKGPLRDNSDFSARAQSKQARCADRGVAMKVQSESLANLSLLDANSFAKSWNACAGAGSGRSIRNRCAAACIGLAIAVALWGFGYRLSRYDLHPNATTRASVAKLWDKHQDLTEASPKAGAADRTDVRLPAQTAFPAFSFAGEPQKAPFCPAETHLRLPIPILSSPVPLRSPPFGSFLV